MNNWQQTQEYLRVEQKYGVEHLLRVARQNRWRAIISLTAACMAMDGALSGFGGHAQLLIGPPAFCLCLMFSILFLQASYRLYQLRERRMAGLAEFLSRADQWWPRLPIGLADMREPVGQIEGVSNEAKQVEYQPGERL